MNYEYSIRCNNAYKYLFVSSLIASYITYF